jgi:hypothetical protein
VLGDVLYLNGSTYAKAIASAANTAEVVGVVSRVIDASTFEMTLSGEISGLTGLTPGEVYFLSAATAGLLTIVEPSVVGQVSLPVGVASSASTLYVAPKRGVVVGAANARTTISIANNTASNVVSVVDYNSLKLEGELNVTRSSGGNQRAYYTVEAAKNGAGVWQVSASYTGDDVLYTTLPSWDVASSQLQVTMPLVTNFSSASLTYALNAPAVGASLPLSVDSSALNIVADAPLSYRNRIINGDMPVWQRGTSFTGITPSLGVIAYTADRWFVAQLIAQSAMDVTQQATGATKYAIRVQKRSGSTGASRNILGQVVENLNCLDLPGKTVTFSFTARAGANYSGTSNALSVQISTCTTADQSSTSFVNGTAVGQATLLSQDVTLTTSNQRFTITTSAVPSNATNICVLFLENSSASAAGANDWYEISDVQLEVGSKASAFERRPYGMELGLAARYYRGFALYSGAKIASAYGYPVFRFPTMRATPTEILFKDTSGNLSRYSTITAGGGITTNRTSPEAAGAAGIDSEGVVITLSNADTDTAFKMYVAVGAEL